MSRPWIFGVSGNPRYTHYHTKTSSSTATQSKSSTTRSSNQPSPGPSHSPTNVPTSNPTRAQFLSNIFTDCDCGQSLSPTSNSTQTQISSNMYQRLHQLHLVQIHLLQNLRSCNSNKVTYFESDYFNFKSNPDPVHFPIAFAAKSPS